ncbi:Por secretion system C-terminal sorting domain-containing protein [Flavobacterium flevense]|uniref:CBM6 domain-containing protein n=1 Tax=Flavobacterium flevense TaxID=983 RepID=A0A4Y4AWJ4_9FLAO|nr:carbohydrate-binding protein [Flavobacterium flevense]GEC72506.1 hypothetical protein FFL01_20450 [Flavobacterium flevense]SHM13629.1 Por secretion system C-terminal sorting domain-containing protein [Flavobacterium flevense]
MTKPKTFKKLVCLFALVISGSYSFAQPSPPAGKVWQKVENLSDEFNTWDSTKWEKPLWDYGLPVKMVAENSGVWDSKLWIRATLGIGDQWFKTSRVQSRANIIFPMYTECSIKSSHLSAFSTFWLNNGDSINRDEIDICESNSKPSWPNQAERPYTLYSQYFVVKNNVTERAASNFDNRYLQNGNPAKGVTWNATYQTLGCYWKDAHNVQFYINGEPAGNVTTTKAFTLGQYIIWDLWTSPNEWTGGIASKTDLSNYSINTMYVDWIHTYSLVDSPAASLTIEAENFGSTGGGTYNDGFVPYGVARSGSIINYVNKGDWVQYSINVATAGTYNISYQIASPMTNAQIQFVLDGAIKTTTNVVNNGSWSNYVPLAGGSVYLSAGSHTVRVNASGSNDWQWNLDKITLNKGIGAKFAKAETKAELISEEKPLSVYPNPAQDELKIENAASYNKVNIYNLTGAKVLSEQLDGNTLNVRKLTNGMYILELIGNQTTQKIKVIIKR